LYILKRIAKIGGSVMLSLKNTILSSSGIDAMKEKIFELLEKKGVKMDHPEILKILDEAGAHVNFDTKQVMFPRVFLEKALAQVPEKVLLAGADSKYDLDIPRQDGTFYLRTCTGAPSYLEPETDIHRRVKISDIAEWARLTDVLSEVNFCAFPSPADVPGETADIHALHTMLRNMKKHIWIQPYSAESVKYLIELAETAVGNKKLKERPLVSFITCSLTPLEFKYMDLEIILQASRRNIPVHACSLPSAGGTAPLTIPGLALLSCAEVLVMLAVSQVVQPGSPAIATPLIFTLDMATGRTLQSSVEAILGASLAVSFLKSAFGVPVHTYGSGSDSPYIDAQSLSERSILGLMVALAGADILGGAGQVEVATTISPIQLIIDNELAGMLRRIVSGVKIDDQSMAWDDLLNVSSGGHFLESESTLLHCRDAFRNVLFTRLSWKAWSKQGQKDLIARAKEMYRKLQIGETQINLAKEVTKEMDEIVKTADRILAK
jgi:trimethylamine--corrinoid protein Co-methyltransferase